VKPVQRTKDLVLPNIAPLTRPVLGVLDEIADRQPDVRFNRREHADHPAASADLHVQPLLAVGRGDPLLIDLGEVIERERVLQPFFQATDGLGETLLVVVDQRRSCPPSALFIRLQPDLLQMGREAPFFPVRDLGQDVAHEVDLAALPRGAQPFLADRGLDAGVGIGDAESRPLHPPGLELAEEGPPGVLRLVEHGLHGQDLPAAGLVYATGDHDRHRDAPSFHSDLLVQRVDPQEGVPLSQGTGLKLSDLGVELLVALRDLGRGDVLDAHSPGQALDFASTYAVDGGFLDDGDQGLLRATPLRDEEGHTATFPQLRDKKIS
jgi:hypothetical protein